MKHLRFVIALWAALVALSIFGHAATLDGAPPSIGSSAAEIRNDDVLEKAELFKRANIRSVTITNPVSVNAIVATSANVPVTMLSEGLELPFVAGATNTGAVTIALDGAAATAVTDSAGATLPAGSIVSGAQYKVRYVFALSQWRLINLNLSPLLYGVSIIPSASTLNAGVSVTQAPAGSFTPSGIWPTFDAILNSINSGSTSTPEQIAVTGAGFADTLQINNYFGGSTSQGGRQTLVVQSQLRNATNAASANRNYVAGVFFASATASDGGTSPAATGTSKGAMFALNPITVLYPGATSFLEATGMETNIALQTGSSAYYKAGMSIASLPSDAVQGTVYDGALSISAQGGAVGWKNGIMFSPVNGAAPVASTGTLIATLGSSTVAHGLDFSSYTFGTDAIKTPGFSVGPSGVAFALKGVFTNATGTSGAQGLTATVTQTQPNASDTGDSATNLAYTLTASSATNELIVRTLNFAATNNLTGGGALTNLRGIDIAFNNNASTTTTIQSGIYIEQGTATGSVGTNYGVYVASGLVGTTKWAFYDAGQIGEYFGHVTLVASTGTNADFLCLSSGGVVLLQTTACTISSRRFKKDIAPLTNNALDEIGKLNVVSFRMKPMEKPNADVNFDKLQLGIIAENVAQVDPRMAIYEQDGVTPKSYRQESVIALLIKGEQELRAANDNLQHEVQRLKTKTK